MLKMILSKLNGHAVEAPSLAEALAQLGRDREAITAEIETLQARRKQALLDDATDAVLDRIERDIDRATVRLEKITLAAAPLRERLAEATAAERRKRWDAHLTDFRERAETFLTAARATAAAHDALLAVRSRATAEGFSRELAALPFTPSVGPAPICSADLLDRFEAALAARQPVAWPPAPSQVAYSAQEAARLAPSGPARRKQAARAPRVGENVPMRLPSGASVQPLERLSLTAPRLPDDDAPLADGEARCIVIQRGYTTPTGEQCQAGRRIRLSSAVARQAALQGAVEILP